MMQSCDLGGLALHRKRLYKIILFNYKQKMEEKQWKILAFFISAGGDKRIVERVQGCVYAGMVLENNGKIKIRPMCMRVNEIGTASVVAAAAVLQPLQFVMRIQEQASRQQLRWIIFSGNEKTSAGIFKGGNTVTEVRAVITQQEGTVSCNFEEVEAYKGSPERI